MYCCFTVRIKPKTAHEYVNLLVYNCCKSPTYFGHLLWPSSENCLTNDIQGDTKKRELLKTPTKFEEIQEKRNLLTEIEPLQPAF